MVNNLKGLVVWGVILCSTTAWPTLGHTQDADTPIAAEAREIIREMSDFLAAQETFSFEAQILFDVVYGGEDGDWALPAEKITFARELEATVQRPDRLAVMVRDASTTVDFLFNGTEVVLHDRGANAFARKAFTGTNDDVIELLRDTYQSDPPLSDLMESDIYAAQMADVTAASYLGIVRLRGQDAHHLAFASEGQDWQVWISANDQPYPVLIQVLNRNAAYWPVYQAWLHNWQFGQEMPANLFDFAPPSDAFSTGFVEDEFASEEEIKE